MSVLTARALALIGRAWRELQAVDQAAAGRVHAHTAVGGGRGQAPVGRVVYESHRASVLRIASHAFAAGDVEHSDAADPEADDQAPASMSRHDSSIHVEKVV